MKPAKRAPIETGTQNKTGVDYDWLPPGTVSTPSKWCTYSAVWLALVQFTINLIMTLLFFLCREKSFTQEPQKSKKQGKNRIVKLKTSLLGVVITIELLYIFLSIWIIVSHWNQKFINSSDKFDRRIKNQCGTFCSVQLSFVAISWRTDHSKTEGLVCQKSITVRCHS